MIASRAASTLRPHTASPRQPLETSKTLTRRHWLAAAATTTACSPAFAQTVGLKISHQFPSGSLTEGDLRDRLCRKFAAEVEKRSAGALKASVYSARR